MQLRRSNLPAAASPRALATESAPPSPVRSKLSPSEAIDCLMGCVEYGEPQTLLAVGMHAIVIIGNTGAGKSTTINYLHDCEFDRVRSSTVLHTVHAAHMDYRQTWWP